MNLDVLFLILRPMQKSKTEKQRIKEKKGKEGKNKKYENAEVVVL